MGAPYNATNLPPQQAVPGVPHPQRSATAMAGPANPSQTPQQTAGKHGKTLTATSSQQSIQRMSKHISKNTHKTKK